MYGEKIRKLRKLQGMSQETLAERIGVTRQTISLWERNAVEPDMVNLMALCEALNIPLQKLLEVEIAIASEKNLKTSNTQPIKKKRIFVLGAVLGMLIMGMIVATVVVGMTAFSSNTGYSSVTDYYFHIPMSNVFAILLTTLISIVIVCIIRICVLVYKRKHQKTKSDK